MIHSPGAKARRSRLIFLLLFSLALLGWFLRSTPPLYTVTDLGAPAGSPPVEAVAINNQGQVLVNEMAQMAVSGQSSTLGSLQPIAFVWQTGALTGLPQPSPRGASGSAINDKGQITGAGGTSQITNQAFLLSSGRMHNLGTLPGYAGGYGTSINSRGQIVGMMFASNGPGLSSPLPSHAFLYSGGRMKALSLLPGWTESKAFAINARGQVVGDSTQTLSFGTSQAFLYDSRTEAMAALPLPLGCTNSHARAINDLGAVVGEVDGAQPGGHAALWQGGSVKDLETLPGASMSIGLAINNQGQAVGNAFIDRDTAWPRFLRYLQRFQGRHAAGAASSGESAWVYRGGKLADLNTLIPGGTGWQLEEAHGINDRGLIVGRGLHDGQTRAFLLTPVQ